MQSPESLPRCRNRRGQADSAALGLALGRGPDNLHRRERVVEAAQVTDQTRGRTPADMRAMSLPKATNR